MKRYSNDVLYQIQSLEQAIAAIEKEILIYSAGVTEEEREIRLLDEYIDTLYESLDFLRESHRVVSMTEFKKIKIDIERIRSLIKTKRSAVQKLVALANSKRPEIERISKILDNLIITGGRGTLLEFKRPK